MMEPLTDLSRAAAGLDLLANGRLRIRLGEERDRDEIYRLRHAVYARELGQHEQNAQGQLQDALDGRNVYLLAELGGDVAGFVSITPPSRAAGASTVYSLEKYLHRDLLPFPLDDGAFEVRLLTVLLPFRGTKVPLLLMWAALRWVEAHGGTRVIGMGRRQLMATYRRLGLEATGIEVRSGMITYEVMHATTSSLRHRLARHGDRLERLRADVDWDLGLPFGAPASCYHGGAFFDAIGTRFDDLRRRERVINADVLDAWFEPSPRVLDALVEHLPWILRTSPPTRCEGMIAAIAEARGVDPLCILPGAGSSALIFLALRHWLTPSSRVLTLDPTYGEYAYVLERLIGCRVDHLRLAREEGYEVDLRLLGELVADRYDLVLLVNPNSPTGRHLPAGALKALAASAPRATRFWIDETYVDYVGADESLEQFAAASSNVVVCKSMSKVYALSGARAAYLCGPSHWISELGPLTPPWAVSLPGQVAAVAALADPEYYRSRWEETHELREALAARLRDACGFDIVPAVANFLLCHLPADGPDAPRLVEECRRSGLFIRDASTMGVAMGRRVVRLAVKDQVTNERMVEIVQGALTALSRTRLQPVDDGDRALVPRPLR